MGETGTLRLAPSAALKEKRLAALLGERGPAGVERAARAVEEAQVAGSLELAALSEPAEAERLSRALRTTPDRAFAIGALLEWHAAVTGRPPGLRSAPIHRPEGPPPCPPEFVRARLENIELWLGGEGAAQLTAGQRGALVLARLVEILPFPDANGRVSRLAASHVMVSAGARPPILAGGDRERLEACLHAAFQLSTQPLVLLLEEASERALDIAIRALAG
jgi:hypothetical protein